MTTQPVVALEIGTAKTTAIVGEAREDGNILVTGLGQCPSCGVRKGMIVDLEKATECVRFAVRAAEESAGVNIRAVNLLVSGTQIASTVNLGSVPVYDQTLGVTADDILEVAHIAKTVSLPHDRDILHSIPQKYTVDDQHGIVNPEKMLGSRLSLDMLIVHGARNLLSQFVLAAESIGLEVTGLACAGLCAALAALTPEQKECGALIIDLGAGVTSYLIYADNIITDVGALPVGGDHLTNDIALGFNLSMQRAESLKRDSGAAMLLNSVAPFQRVTIPSEGGFAATTVAATDLHTIVNARITELFELIHKSLEIPNLWQPLGAGVVLTGGGAHLRGVAAVAERVFDMPCAIGKPKNFSGMANIYESPEYAALLGLIRYALKNARHEPPAGWWRKITHWLGH